MPGCVVHGLGHGGYDIPGISGKKSANFNDCIKRCKRTPTCVVCDYHKSKNMCYLHHTYLGKQLYRSDDLLLWKKNCNPRKYNTLPYSNSFSSVTSIGSSFERSGRKNGIVYSVADSKLLQLTIFTVF